MVLNMSLSIPLNTAPLVPLIMVLNIVTKRVSFKILKFIFLNRMHL